MQNARFILGPPPQDTDVEYAQYLAGLRSSTEVPYILASNDSEKPWRSMAEGMGPEWLRSVAGDLKTVDAVAEKISQEGWTDDELAESGMLRTMSTPDFLKTMRQTMSPEALKALSTLEGVKEMVAVMPEAAKQKTIARERRLRTLRLATMLTQINDGNTEVTNADSIPENVALLMKLKPAYQAGDARAFNETLETYLASINEKPPTYYSSFTNWLERIYNSANPFYLAIVIYVVSLVFVFISWAGVGWQGWRVSTGRIAVGLLMLGLLIHTVGIVMRVAISGRPPVTNLYSSVIFVTAAGIVIALLMELFTRMSVGTMLGSISGLGGLLWAHSMTVVDGDTFTVMVAVLDTTFWLATHVIMISLGYAATFMAGLAGFSLLVWLDLHACFQRQKKQSLVF